VSFEVCPGKKKAPGSPEAPRGDRRLVVRDAMVETLY